MKREDGGLSGGANIGEPLRVHGGEKAADLSLEGLVLTSLREDEKGLELVLGSLVSPLREQLDDHEAGRPQGAASGWKLHRRLRRHRKPG